MNTTPTPANLSQLPFMDNTLELEKRVDDLLNRLTLDEKFALCVGKSFFSANGVKRLEIKPFKMTDGPHGVAPHSSKFKRNTYFPTSICLGATWNPDIAEEYGKAVAEETRAVGDHMILGPGVNICRTPVNGRTFEYLTEDPVLNSQLAISVVKGVQGQRISACVKHFAANNQETRRMSVSTEVSERALQEIYLPAFKAVVKEADAWSIMACYNRVNGVFGCENKDLLIHRLREEYGFRGFVVSDWFATKPTKSSGTCINAGLSLEMPGKGIMYKKKILREAFEDGEFTEETLDRNLRWFLTVMFQVGLCDDKDCLPKGSRNTIAHQQVARKIAEQGMTLLKNDNDLLPLNIDNIKKLAVIGPNAKKKMSKLLYGGSSAIWPPYEITPFQGLEIKGKDKFELTDSPSDADAAIVVAGLNHWFGNDCEGKDRRDLVLPQTQIDLINETVKQNPNTIVVLINGSPVAMEGWVEKVPAILEAWYPGMEGGHVIADIIFGDINPSGKLPLTFPKKLSDSPAHESKQTFPGKDKVFYDEGIFVGYRHFDTRDIDPLFPFGHGLSYTRFEYDNLAISPNTTSKEGIFDVSCDVKNMGDRKGSETVQLYVQDVECSVERPLKELKRFEKILLEPGRETTASFTLEKKDLSFFDESKHQWVAEEGMFKILIGSSSRDIRLKDDVEYKS